VAVRLYRCSARWVKFGGHPCWQVEKALIDAGIEHEVVTGAAMPWQRKQRETLIELTGQDRYPAIQFENGRVYREESKDMVATIAGGKLSEKAGGGAAASASESSGLLTPGAGRQ
jgi:hypothetical protein